MTIFLLITALILSIGLNIATIILIRILLTKNKIHEQWILEFKSHVENALGELREIDSKGTFATSVNDKGTFESDDQVGQIFKELLEVIDKLNQRIQ